MPTYCYSDKHGNVIEREYAIGDAPRLLRVGGRLFARDLGAEQRGTIGTPAIEGERRSLALGCIPQQEAEMEANAKRYGFSNVHFHNGEAVFPSRRVRKEYCKLFGYRDFDGGYGDP